jgi:endonuclease-8
MPEGDTVFAMAARLHAALAGRELTGTDFRVPRYATVDLSGQRLRELAARGKHLLFRTDGDLTVHSHLKMEGAWRLYAPGRRWGGPTHEIRAVLRTDRSIAVGHRLGTLRILPTRSEAIVLRDLGPDVLGSDWDVDEVTRRLTRDPERPLGAAVIDQRVMAGPGNVYRSEVCFLAGADPRTSVGEIDDPHRIAVLTKDLMEANRSGGRRVTTGDARRGRELWVYGRAGSPCRRCGTVIRRVDVADSSQQRVAYVCPACQPAPGVAS